MAVATGTTGIAVVIGRSLAACAHPYAAWRVFPKSKRTLIALGYFWAGFISVLGALLVAGSRSL